MQENIFVKYSDIKNCPVRNVLDRIGDKWSMLVLMLLSEQEVLRFTGIQKHISTISEKMLSVTLKSLEADGLIGRKVYPQIPPKVEYHLTERGKSLIPHLLSLADWANSNMTSIRRSRKRFERI